MSAEAFTSGIFAAVVTREGESAPVGAPVALIAKKEADVRPCIHCTWVLHAHSFSLHILLPAPSSLALTPSLLAVRPPPQVAALQAYAQVLRSGGGAAPAAAAPAAAAAPVAAAPAAAAAPIVNDGRVIASGYAKKVWK